MTKPINTLVNLVTAINFMVSFIVSLIVIVILQLAGMWVKGWMIANYYWPTS